MSRSIIAVTVGVLLGVALVIFMSFLVSSMTLSGGVAPAKDMNAMTLASQIGVVGVWFGGSLIGSMTASAISLRWAPTAWVVAATMGLFAMSNFMSVPAPFWMPVFSYALIAFAGQVAILLTKATYTRQAPPRSRPGL